MKITIKYIEQVDTLNYGYATYFPNGKIIRGLQVNPF